MHNTTIGTFFLAAAALAPHSLASPSRPAQDLGVRYEREGDTVYRIESAGRFRVDPTVISARFRAPVLDLAGFEAELDAPVAVLQGLWTVRSNRLGVHDIEVPAGRDVLEVVAAMRATGLVDFAEENTIGEYVIDPNDSQFGQQWALKNTGQSGGTVDADIDADQAWDLAVGNPAFVIAVLDSGTEISHPDLVTNTWLNTADPVGGGDNDGNGYVDDYWGWDFYNNNNSVPGPFFHGTFVTGIISAQTNNAAGIAGVAGGFNGGDGCLTMACGVGDNFPSGSILDDAILYAADNGAVVITMSLSVGPSSAIDAALDYARNTRGLFIDCAAGNGGGSVSYPANNPNVAAIASTNRFDQRSGFSNPGSQLWVSAPGEDVRSTTTGGGYTDSSGTSFSAPHVAGVVGLMRSAMPAMSISPDGVENVLKVTADDVGAAGFDNLTGWGRINAHAAVLHMLAGDCNGNNVYDFDDIAANTSSDTNGNGIPDECECVQSQTTYCTAAPNSVGPGAMISAFGSSSIGANDLTLTTSGVPIGTFALYFYGGTQIQVPLYEGFRCVGQPFYRLPITTSDNLGIVNWPLDVNAPPQAAGQITAGSTWNFQCFYRDPAGGGTSSNLSNGLEVAFCN